MLQWLKNILKRILPPPVRSFNREIERIISATEANRLAIDGIRKELEMREKRMEEFLQDQFKLFENNIINSVEQSYAVNQKNMSQIEKNIQSQTNSFYHEEKSQLQRLFELENKHNEQLLSQLKRIEKMIPNKPIYWTNESERNIVKENWGDISLDPDFADKFINLTSGMDSNSIESIIRILKRQQKYLNTDQKQLDLFTRKEQEELRLLKENFNDEIIKLSDNLFAYKQYLLPISRFESSVFYFKHGIEQITHPEIIKGKAIIDVGGFVGDSVLVLSELKPSEIYTFEANPDNFELLKETLRLNNIKNVIAENVALGAQPGNIVMHTLGSASTTIERRGLQYVDDIEVPVIRFDDYVMNHPMQIGLIKVDIEGGEPAFLEGAKKTICEQRPVLLLSIYHNANDFFMLKPMIESWNLGYKFSIHKPTYGNATSETLLIAEP